jgi:hypothetical protein
MEAWHLPNNFCIALEKGVAHTTNHAGTTTDIPLPFRLPINPGCMQLREAFKETSNIGWIKALKGSLSTRWHDYVASHLKLQKSRLKADEWAAKFVSALWEQILCIWKYRNDAFHADNVQTRGTRAQQDTTP